MLSASENKAHEITERARQITKNLQEHEGGQSQLLKWFDDQTRRIEVSKGLVSKNQDYSRNEAWNIDEGVDNIDLNSDQLGFSPPVENFLS